MRALLFGGNRTPGWTYTVIGVIGVALYRLVDRIAKA